MAAGNVTRRLFNTTQLPELVLSTAQLLCEACNGTDANATHLRAKRAKSEFFQ
jgi:hypothetical protein